jgi:hypothetical protein
MDYFLVERGSSFVLQPSLARSSADRHDYFPVMIGRPGLALRGVKTEISVLVDFRPDLALGLQISENLEPV